MSIEAKWANGESSLPQFRSPINIKWVWGNGESGAFPAFLLLSIEAKWANGESILPRARPAQNIEWVWANGGSGAGEYVNALLNNYSLSGDSGSFVLAGTAASLLRGYRVVAESGGFVLTGQAVNLAYSWYRGECIDHYKFRKHRRKF